MSIQDIVRKAMDRICFAKDVPVSQIIEEAIQQAVESEREACAQLAEEFFIAEFGVSPTENSGWVSNTIRQRGTK